MRVSIIRTRIPRAAHPHRDLCLELRAGHSSSTELLRDKSHDPYFVGRRLKNDNEQTYQDNLVAYIKKHGTIPDDGKPYVVP
ncbi:uncharacterized protein B0H18DRAFT_1130043 [Fomitopsis serialis]|uniref:uncharacterized protein n=1 Tax=Fomitopsis serialis TaxID=139415 RepID=UPI0020072BFD|nr:uncharacterized protein B0H18DRAFT_1130043 [Neoantrodia serialis]KAH9910480.1 hypothetical protein B0H18DRAFT_1130043 [Neoantrodia serialis]